MNTKTNTAQLSALAAAEHANDQANQLEAQGLRGTRQWHAWAEAAAKYTDEALEG